ncbi:hypothetical protein [Azospirillum sp. B2RO_4]|uniref:hypothetical protein n=1 Tax=Azospirillum sp. B2RO_4 TaxID=3027796 RepID=UPI003DA987E5
MTSSYTDDFSDEDFVRYVEFRRKIESRYALTMKDLLALESTLFEIIEDQNLDKSIRYFVYMNDGMIIKRSSAIDISELCYSGEEIIKLEIRIDGEEFKFEMIFDRFIQGNRRSGIIYVFIKAHRQVIHRFKTFFDVFSKKLRKRSSVFLSNIEISALSPLAVAMSILGSQLMNLLHELNIVTSLAKMFWICAFAVGGMYISAGGLTNLMNPFYPFAMIDPSIDGSSCRRLKNRRTFLIISVIFAVFIGLITNFAYDAIKTWIGR